MCQSANRFDGVDLVHGLPLCWSQRIGNGLRRVAIFHPPGSFPLCQSPNHHSFPSFPTESCNLITSQTTDPTKSSHQPTGFPLVIEPRRPGSSCPLLPLTNNEVRKYQSPQCMGSQRRGSEFLLSPRPARCPECVNTPNLPD